MSKTKNTRYYIQRITLLAMLIAARIIIARFLSINLPYLRIGFAFLPVALAARQYGPVGGMIVDGLGDFLGAILFPGGTFIPGLTLTAILTGCCFGFFLYKKCNFKRIVLSVFITQIFGSTLLNSYWFSLVFGKAYLVILPQRLLQSCVLIIIELITLPLVFKYLQKLDKKYSFSKKS